MTNPNTSSRIPAPARRRARLALAVGLGAALLASLAAPGAAEAQYGAPYYPPPPPPRGMYRSGLLVGFGIGGGAITASNCETCGGGAFGLEFHIGGMVNPQTAIMFDVWGLGRSVGDATTLTNTIYTGSVQFWATPIFWLKGGLGGGYINLSDDYGGGSFGNETALAVNTGAGVELVQSYNFALDLQLRFAHAFYADGGANNIALMLGVNWY